MPLAKGWLKPPMPSWRYIIDDISTIKQSWCQQRIILFYVLYPFVMASTGICSTLLVGKKQGYTAHCHSVFVG
jgi:hypothetical protein